MAAKIKTIDIIYIEGKIGSLLLDHVHSLYSRVTGLQKQPVVSYPYGKNEPRRHKLPVAMIALWKERNKSVNARPR